MIFNESDVSYLVAFIGGVVTFFASCLLPLVPTYLAYLSGVALNSKSIEGKKFGIIAHSLLFIMGFIAIFVLLGASASTFGKIIIAYKPFLQKIGGVFLLLMGLFMLKVIKPSWLYQEHKLNHKSKLSNIPFLNSLLMGFVFGFAWTPCIGPILAVILFWASQAGSIFQGMILLLVYGAGLGLPFLIIGVFFELLSKKLHLANKFGKILNTIAGIVIVIMGLLMLTGSVDFVSIKLLQFFDLNTLSI